MGLFIISILIFIVCVLMILIVLAQNSKGGGLTSSFSSGNQIMGVKRTSDFLEKTTWTLAVVLLVLSLSTVFVMDDTPTVETNEMEENNYLRNSENPQAIPYNQPATEAAPAQEQPAAPAEGEALPTE